MPPRSQRTVSKYCAQIMTLHVTKFFKKKGDERKSPDVVLYSSFQE